MTQRSGHHGWLTLLWSIAHVALERSSLFVSINSCVLLSVHLCVVAVGHIPPVPSVPQNVVPPNMMSDGRNQTEAANDVCYELQHLQREGIWIQRTFKVPIPFMILINPVSQVTTINNDSSSLVLRKLNSFENYCPLESGVNTHSLGISQRFLQLVHPYPM